MRPERLVLALVALGALVLAGASDFVIGGFWSGHPMLTAILSALVVILLSAAVIDVILSRRDENRWRVLAHSALIQLAESAHTTWSNLAEDLGLGALGDRPPAEVRAELTSTSRAPVIHRQAASNLADPARREHLDGRLTAGLQSGQELITRWAVPMTASESYAAIFDRHVEMSQQPARHAQRRGLARGRDLAAGSPRAAEAWWDERTLRLAAAAHPPERRR